jgi:4-amino-4-deoxy-L-arabinose transferase-like glycosyltransferase
LKPGKLDSSTPGPHTNWLTSRAALIVAFAAVLLGVIVFYTGARWLAVISVAVFDGGAAALWVLAAWMLGSAIWIPRWSGDRAGGPLGFAAQAALGMGIIGFAGLALGLAGMLNRWTALAVLLIGPICPLPGAINAMRRSREIRIDRWLATPAGAHWLLLAAAPALAMMLIAASITPGLLWKPEDPHPYDVLEYHLHVPREWFELGRIAGLHHNVFSYFPFGVEMHYLLAMHVRGGPWAAMYQCQLLSTAWSLLTAAAVYGTAKTLCGNRAIASAAAVIAIASPWIVMLGSVGYTETALALYTCLAVAWALRALNADDAQRSRNLVVAGVMAGLACGVKYTAVPMVLGALGLSLLVLMIATRDVARWWRGLALYALAGALLASPWLFRNAIWTHNPVFPLAMKTLGRAHFDPIQQQRFELAHSPKPEDRPLLARFQRAGREILIGWQFGYVIWPLAAAGLVLAKARRREMLLLAALLLTILVIWIGFTHLLGRFFVLCIPIAAIAVALATPKQWRQVAATGAIFLVLVSCWNLHPRLREFTAKAANGFYGLDDLSYFTAPELEHVAAGENVYLIGDAEAFLYRFPANQLHYRTVFDLPSDAKDMYQAWTGMPKDQIHGTLVINPMEVHRLATHYYRVPDLPPDFSDPTDQVTIRHP